MIVFITGATGFVGGEIVTRLLAAGHEVKALVRTNSAKGTAQLSPAVRIVAGDVLDPDLAPRLAGADAVIHLVGIIRAQPRQGVTFERLHLEATSNLVRAMAKAGVKRLVHMSALGARPDAPTAYFRTKGQAEAMVRGSALDWTIMRPSVIFGPRDEFVNLLAKQVRLAPIVPVIGDGEYLLQPVAAANVADGFGKALVRPETIGRSFDVGGPERLTYNRVLDAIAAALGKKPPPKLHLPLGPIKLMIRALEAAPFFPITSDQLAMLLMNNVCDHQPFFQTFGLTPIRFEDGIKTYLA